MPRVCIVIFIGTYNVMHVPSITNKIINVQSTQLVSRLCNVVRTPFRALTSNSTLHIIVIYLDTSNPTLTRKLYFPPLLFPLMTISPSPVTYHHQKHRHHHHNHRRSRHRHPSFRSSPPSHVLQATHTWLCKLTTETSKNNQAQTESK